MKRPVVAWTLGAVALFVSLATAAVQSENHERARRLAEIQRRCEMVEAANVQAQALVRAHVWGEPNRPLAKRGREAKRETKAVQQ
ncbi:MAG: hypothetical protein K8S98_06930 [Planctomycetes bacterium]|nr:hypothetical protein [Planctomycetota bacterium]